MELERGGKCWFCLDPIISRNTHLSNGDVKIYKDIFYSSKKYLDEEEVIRFSIDWNNSEGLLSPFCTNCFTSAEIIHRVSKELEEIQEHLKNLVETFTRDVKLKTSKYLKEKCDSIGLVEEENESEKEVYIKKEIDDNTFDEGDEHSIPHSDEAVTFSDDIHSNNSIFGDDDEQIVSGDVEDPGYAEGLQSDKDGDINKWIYKNVGNTSSVTGQQQITTSTTSNLLTAANTVNLDSNGLRGDNAPENEKNPLLVGDSETTMSADQFVPLNIKIEAEEFICDFCSEVCESEYVLLLHKRMNHNCKKRIKFKCPTCNKCFSRVMLERHVKLCENAPNDVKIGENPFKCSICKKTFANMDILNLHGKLHEERPFHCESCHRLFVTEVQLNKHMLVHEARDKEEMLSTPGKRRKDPTVPFECEICKKTFKFRATLKYHIEATHQKIGKYKCKNCEESFAKMSELTRHAFTHKVLLKCDICGIERKSLTAHLKYCHTVYTHGYTEEKYKCETCGNAFSRQFDYKMHLRKHTEEEVAHPCNFCGKTFAQKQHLKAHMYKHKKGGSFASEIGMCDEKFKSKAHMYKHKKGGSFACEIGMCDEKFKSNHHLRAHIKLFHNKSLYYQCVTCGKSFGTSATLEQHKTTHKDSSDTKKFKCQICGDTFPLRVTLIAHLKQCHTVETQGDSRKKTTFNCQKCEKQFSNSHDLEIHCRSHTNERSYSCSFCGKTFADSSIWYKHFRQQHLAQK